MVTLPGRISIRILIESNKPRGLVQQMQENWAKQPTLTLQIMPIFAVRCRRYPAPGYSCLAADGPWGILPLFLRKALQRTANPNPRQGQSIKADEFYWDKTLLQTKMPLRWESAPSPIAPDRADSCLTAPRTYDRSTGGTLRCEPGPAIRCWRGTIPRCPPDLPPN